MYCSGRTTPSYVFYVAWLLLRADRVKAAPSPAGLLAIQGYGTPFTIWLTPPGGATRRAKPSILP